MIPYTFGVLLNLLKGRKPKAITYYYLARREAKGEEEKNEREQEEEEDSQKVQA